MPKAKSKLNKTNLVKLPPHSYKAVVSTLSQSMGWGIRQNNIPNTWTVTRGEGEVVVIIDTGSPNHIDIGNNILSSYVVNSLKDCGVQDDEGHETHCAGIICAKDNSEGMVGVAPDAKVISIKALDINGSGSMESIHEALDMALTLRPSVVSMSLGTPVGDSELHEKIIKLYEANIPVVCAAGNSGARGVDYPAKYPECISVAAYDKNGKIADFSAVGERVDWAAPGVEIYSTFLNNQYAIMQGTSMACPYIAGIILLLLAKHKKQEKETGENDCRTVEQIRQHLLKYTVDKGYVGKDKYYGYGIIDVENMILAQNDPALNLPIAKVTIWQRFLKWYRSLAWK